MRVAYVCTDPGIPVFGAKGASVHVQAVCRQLVRQGADVHVLTPRPGGRPPEDLPVTVHALPSVGGPDAGARERAARATDRAVAEVLHRLHDESPLDLVYERYALWGRTASHWARRQQVRHVLEVNAPLPQEQARHRSLVDADGAGRVAHDVIRASHTVVCVSEAVARWARGAGSRDSGVHTVPNGVDTDAIGPAPLRSQPRPFTVGFVGTLKPWHGAAGLVDALALLSDPSGPAAPHAPPFRLLVVGDGPERATLEARARDLGVQHLVDITGQVAHDEVPSLLSCMDVGVAPYPASDDFYFSPLKIYEYLAAGLPVVATAVGPLPDLVGPDVGVVVPPDDPAALAAAIRCLADDVDRRAAIAVRARQVAVDRHDWRQVVRTVLELAEVPGVPAP